MAKIKEKQIAINLRLQGWTYSVIKKETGISKSTLSDWLSRYPLSEKQLLSLQANRTKSREIAIEKTRASKLKKRQLRLNNAYIIERKRWEKLNKRELELAGLFIYWGEGSKNPKTQISLSNTDPQVLKFTLFWMVTILEIPRERIHVFLHLYSDMNIKKELLFWSNELQLPLSQFSKPYIKANKHIEVFHKGFGHGTCGLSVNNVILKEKILMGIKSIADFYSK